MDERVYYLALHLAKGIGPKKKRDLLDYYKDAQTLFALPESDIKNALSIEKKCELVSSRNTLLERAQQELEKARNLGIDITHIKAKDYPTNLLMIPDPPIALYYKGRLAKGDFNSISIVGCRDTTPLGAKNARRLGRNLAKTGITVVSGLALGIDSEAHKGALEVKGRTVAVLGCGIDKVYPKNNEKLQETIAETGCLFSEYPIGTDPIGRNFPIRNRIICGLSVGVVVVEGSRDSGSLYTARFALDYGRELYAFPGPAQSYHYSGTHDLIKKGAKLIESSDDLLEDLSYVLDIKLIKEKKFDTLEKNDPKIIEKHDPLTDTYEMTGTNECPVLLTEDEIMICNCLSMNNKKSIDLIIEETKFRVEKVMSGLTSLVLKEQCTQIGNYYILNPSGGIKNVG